MSKLHLSVGGMHCSLCIKSITRALTRMDGVVSAHVSLAHQEVLVDYDATRIYPDQMIRTLSALGFKPQEPEQAALSEEEELVKSKRIAAVAVVLLSLATTIMVISRWHGVSPGRIYAQALLAAVTAIWPAWFVLRNGWESVRRGIFNQDVLAAVAAIAAATGGIIGLNNPMFPAGAFFSVATYILGFHCLGGYSSMAIIRASGEAAE